MKTNGEFKDIKKAADEAVLDQNKLPVDKLEQVTGGAFGRGVDSLPDYFSYRDTDANINESYHVDTTRNRGPRIGG